MLIFSLNILRQYAASIYQSQCLSVSQMYGLEKNVHCPIPPCCEIVFTCASGVPVDGVTQGKWQTV